MTAWRILGVSTAAIPAMMVALPAYAGDVPAVTEKLILDIIVTAERRPDSVQQVPIAVSAYNNYMLSARNLDTPLALANDVPNLFASSAVGLGSLNSYTLRGLGQSSTDATFSPSVGTFIDDVYIAPGAGNNFLFFDVDRAEVLRGPQSSLYGRNTSGGAVNIVIARPSETLGGYGEFAYGAFDRKTARGSINLPLSPVVQLKVSGYFQNDDGYVTNSTTGEKLNDSDAAGIRGALQFKVTDTLRWNLAATYMRNDGDNLPNSLCDPNAPAQCSGRYSATARRVDPAFSATNPLIPLGNRLDTQIYTSHIDWVGENFALASITGFVDSRARSAIDLSDGRPFPNTAVPFPAPGSGLDGGPAGYAPVTNIGHGQQFSQELKLTGSLLDGRIDYIAGLLYFDASDKSDRGYAVIDNGTIDRAAYVQADFNATDRLKLTAGVRYTDEKTSFAIVDTSAGCQSSPGTCVTAVGLAVAGVPTNAKAKIWSPRFAASYRVAEDVMVYASASRGFRSGGWDASTLSTIRAFGAENVWSYEGGVKADAFGGKVRANLAAFWLESANAQAPLLVGGVPVVQNVHGYRNRGVELEVIAAPIAGLNLRASVGYQNDTYRAGGSVLVAAQQGACIAELARGLIPLAPAGPQAAGSCAIGIVDANGHIAEPARTPDFSLGLGAGYDWTIPAAGIILTPSVNGLYRTAFEAGTANATLFTGSSNGLGGVAFPANPFGDNVITGSHNPAVWQVAAALTLRTDDNNWTLALECANCLDTSFTQSVVGTVRYLNPPRVWQIRARRVF